MVKWFLSKFVFYVWYKMLEKPAIGEKCNGCGLCCQVQVCSTGSFALGLVDKLGDRASGPCPALTPDGDRRVCGLVKRPRDWLPSNPHGVTPLRNAVMLLISAGLGCDEAGEEPDETALPKLRAMGDRYLSDHPRSEINAAAALVFYSRFK